LTYRCERNTSPSLAAQMSVALVKFLRMSSVLSFVTSWQVNDDQMMPRSMSRPDYLTITRQCQECRERGGHDTEPALSIQNWYSNPFEYAQGGDSNHGF
jgi:hypothetical protein